MLNRFISISYITLLCILGTSYAESKPSQSNRPKYVFMFIGDGLGSSQRQIAEYYLKEVTNNPHKKLTMTQMPALGINTTHSMNSLVTDSAAAGTALATGFKTNSGTISQLPDGRKLTTILEAAEKKNIATGIVTTTRITHATPASFAAHNSSRSAENEIAEDYLKNDIEFIAGGGLRHFLPKGENSKRKDDKNLINSFTKKGYETFLLEKDVKRFKDYKPQADKKVLALFSYTHLPYEVDRKNKKETPSLSELTAKAIDHLSLQKNGFFLMVEGGRIDHACHAHDAAGAIHDTLALDAAIYEATKFYKKHPKDTLILVVGDHETGGMGLGFGTNYFLKLKNLKPVKASIEDSLQNIYKGDADKFYSYIATNFGLKDLTPEEKKEIEKAMKASDRKRENPKDKVKGYGYYDPVAVAVGHVVSKRLNIYWTTYAHTATQIPLSAMGRNATSFNGYKDNTEVAKTLAKIMGIELGTK